MKLSRIQREQLRGKFGGRCAYCGCVLSEKWHVDHIQAVQRDARYDRDKGRYIQTGRLLAPGNDCRENMNPSCAPCNIDKGMMPVNDWREYLQHRIVEGLRRNSSTFRHAERFGMISVSQEPLVFWFERYKDKEDAA